MSALATIRIRDYSLEKSSFGVEGVTLSAANFTAQDALLDALVAAVGNIVIGTPENLAWLAVNEAIAGVDPTSPYAQRELKWLVTAKETTDGTVHSFQIPTPNLDFLVPGSDIGDLTGTEMAAFVTAFEAYWRANGAAAGTVQQMRLIGRNL